MGRLFWKIFLWFWSAMLLTGFAIAWGIATLIDNSDLESRYSQHKRMLQERVESLAQIMTYNGAYSAKRFLLMRSQRRKFGIQQLGESEATQQEGFETIPPPEVKIYIVDNEGIDILQRQLPRWIDFGSVKNSNADEANVAQLSHSVHIVEKALTYSMTQPVVSIDGEPYTILAGLLMPKTPIVDLQKVVPFGLAQMIEKHPQLMQIRIAIALLLSSLFCFGLSWYLVKPMKLLRSASKSIAEGHLETRVAQAIGHRGDELESLGIDFDYMADRIQTLVSTQQNLLNDVSHELRSPLARLQVAVGLAQQKVGNNISNELERIELETTRLNDLLGQVLTLARLDSGVIDQQDDYVDLVALLEDIAVDANFEAANANKHVLVEYNSNCSVQANLSLLHRALENIVRNAVKYTAQDTMVKIRLSALESSVQRVLIEICDYGDGVPESALPRLFEPFFRVATARDRSSGGYGLGLAIAKRAISAHQGSVTAHNREGGGLCVSIELPIKI